MEKKVLAPESAPKAIGPYSVGIEAGDFIFLSGQLPINVATGELVKESVAKETEIILENAKKILEECGSSLEKVVKTTVFLKDIAKFAEMNEVYAKYFTANPPARSAFQVAALPKDADVEIEFIALK